jgi:hypothetical protein
MLLLVMRLSMSCAEERVLADGQRLSDRYIGALSIAVGWISFARLKLGRKREHKAFTVPRM